MMEPDADFVRSLAACGITVQGLRDGRFVISRQAGPVWPDRGNSFWIVHAAGHWHLSTWLPACYRVPRSDQLADLCVDCMDCGTSAMWRASEDIIAKYALEELSDDQCDALFG